MKRIYPEHTYGPGPRRGCWWDETCDAPEWPVFDTGPAVDVAIVGAGFTGLSAALHLAEAGVSVAVLDAEAPGWGASGRNGGFCCLGGAKLDHRQMVQKYGTEAAQEYQRAEKDAVDLVADLLGRLGIDADTHSDGETVVAHRARDMESFRHQAETIEQSYGVMPTLIEKNEMGENGMAGRFYGALTTPIGFALNPRKYVTGLASAAAEAGAALFQQSPVTGIAKSTNGYTLAMPTGHLHASKVIVATNGYSSDDLPDWLSGRYLPTQSNVIVTRPLTDAELAAQGWTSHQMCYDTRNLLHYFRLMPNRRFLFGMRGGLRSSETADVRSARRNRQDFEKLFPAWKRVETTNSWSGMVCLSRRLVPFVGPVPNMPDVFAGLAYHGNGVAMGSYAGKKLADSVLGFANVPSVMQKQMQQFPLGLSRRALMLPAYAGFMLADL